MFNGSGAILKYYRRLKIYKNSTNTVGFDPETLRGHSYNWTFVAPVNGVLVFNEYHYSSTTSNHQSLVSGVLRELKLDYVRGDFGPTDVRSLGLSAVSGLYFQLYKLEIQIESTSGKRLESWAHKGRVAEAKYIRENILKLERLDKRFRFPEQDKKALREAAEFAELDRISAAESEKCFKFLTLKNMASDLNQINLGDI